MMDSKLAILLLYTVSLIKNFNLINEKSSLYLEYLDYCKQFQKTASFFRFEIFKLRKSKILMRNKINKLKNDFLSDLSQFSDLEKSERIRFLAPSRISLNGNPKVSLTIIEKIKSRKNFAKLKLNQSWKKLKARINGTEITFLKEFVKTHKRSVDWVKENKVTSIKNQGLCGSCWAFATNASVESIYLIKQNKQYDLSEQEMIDCSYTMDCGGGWNDQALSYIKDNGIVTEEDYPYQAIKGTCKKLNNFQKIKISDFITIQKGDMKLFLERLEIQPISVAIMVTNSFLEYKSGVFDADRNCGKLNSVNHAVTAVGYYINESDYNKSYLIFKNQWGKVWGEDGYFRLSLKDIRYDDGPCNIIKFAAHTVFPILNN